ncbi:2-hydroxyisoflavanone dehydratase-like [Solanum pennellii]|uniref:2-hydroxyisoflavanone dehydratase-like n=1 Tax=Solanum pennellii TaxID=28526 RepID=A0A0U3AL73_SOLPN|nr:2-hydroxyisoflavanone dehydratase-like [Solanum pennellii]ALT22036.1 acylsugar acylhydrolase 1 [Solanum pennellii]
MADSDNNNNDIVTDFFPYYRLYKDGRVERFYELAGVHQVPPSLEDPATGVSSKDVSISAHVSARLYLPKNTSPNQKLPVLVYYHGGGLVLGSAFFKTEHCYLNHLVSESNCIAISVDYRLAPEHDIPTIFQDCWDALQWVASHSVSDTINKEPWIENHSNFNRLFVGGDSAGGNIVYNMIMRAGREKLIGDVKILGAILGFPYLMIPSIENYDKGIAYKLWNIICPLSERGNDSPMVNPVSKKCPSLSKLGCSRLFVCTGEKDELVPGEVAIKFAEAVKKSGWEGEIESILVEGEGHCFQCENPQAEKSKDLIKRIVSFIQRD